MPTIKDKLTDWMAKRMAKACEHRNVTQSGNHCPECGHRVLIEWAFIRCASCNVKRPPFRQPGVYNYKPDMVKPMQKFCKNCGTAEYSVLKKGKIDAYELLFAIPLKHVDTEAAIKTAVKSQGDAFEATRPEERPSPETPSPALNVLESNGLLYSYNTRPQLKTSPYSWQPNRQTSTNLAPASPFALKPSSTTL